MRNTAPPLSIETRQDNDLLEDLCLALRDVGVGTWGLPDDERAVSAIKNVQQIYAELERRKIDVQPRLERLSQETSWQMEPLLKECLAYPEATPYVRDADGVRRAFRCSICQQREFPDREGIFLCDVCLAQANESFETKIPPEGLLLLRIYNAEYWCKHADADTVLMAFDDYGSLENTWCVQCVNEEQERRSAKI